MPCTEMVENMKEGTDLGGVPPQLGTRLADAHNPSGNITYT